METQYPLTVATTGWRDCPSMDPSHDVSGGDSGNCSGSTRGGNVSLRGSGLRDM